MANCRSCNAEINWTKTKNGKNMPIDYNPELQQLFDMPGDVEFEPKLGMVSHFDTCPNANQHRRQR